MRNIILIIICFCSVSFLRAQQFGDLLLAKNDASLLIENYTSPVAKGMMYSMNGGWYSTAKSHKLFGFDVMITASAAIVPDADKMFDFVADDYQFLSLPNNETSLPTVVGDSGQQVLVNVSIPLDNGLYQTTSFEMPSGVSEDLPMAAIPIPMAQIGVGLPFKTDAKLRYVPKLNVDSRVSTSLIGLGLQHDLTQYLKLAKLAPFRVSVLAAYTNVEVLYDIKDGQAENVTVADGELSFKMDTWTLQALGSVNLKIINFYAGIGLNYGDTAIAVDGSYRLNYAIKDDNGNTLNTITETVIDPVALGFNITGMRTTLGARLNLGFFKVFADYTIQEYQTATIGMAFSFR